MTLAEWVERTKIKPTTPTTEKNAVSVIVNPHSREHNDLWHLTDYQVSSACFSVVWLVPRN